MMTMETAKKKVFIAIPHEGWIKPQLAIYLWDLLHNSGEYILKVAFYQERPIQQNYHKIVAEFLKTDFDFLAIFNVDIVPSKSFLPLLKEGKDIIGLPIPTWKENETLIWLILDRQGDEGYKMKDIDGSEGWVECDAVGGGALILSRRVLEELPRPFEILWGEDGLLKEGSDFNFCRRAKEKGFKVWTHLQYKCSHFGDKGTLDFLDLNNLLRDLQQRVPKRG